MEDNVKSILLAMIFFSSITFAGGKLTVQQAYDHQGKTYIGPLLGFSVFQKITEKVAYNGWVGTGEPLFESDVKPHWFTMKHAAEIYFGKYMFSTGIQSVWDTNGIKYRHDLVFVKASYQLW